MRTILLTFAGLFATPASLTPVKRQARNFITDGSFEAVGAEDWKKTEMTAGDWALDGSAVFTSNSIEPAPYTTPYGKVYLQFNGTQDAAGVISTAKQNVTGLALRKTATLTYSYRRWPTTSRCELISYVFYYSNGEYRGEAFDAFFPTKSGSWQARSATFGPRNTTVTLEFDMYCADNDNKSDYFLLGLDDVSMTQCTTKNC